MIEGGYILQPRAIKGSSIMNAPPCTREVWFYLIRNANSSENKYKGYYIKRGQLFRDYKTIIEDLSWAVGNRKEKYSDGQMKRAMSALRKAGRITTTKKPGGVLITICKYDYYQNPKNYERTNERTNDRTDNKPVTNQPAPINNKNKKNDKNLNERQMAFYNSLNIYKNEFSEKTVNDFYSYWSEPNKIKTKMKFELEKTWDTKRRLRRWKDNEEKYAKNIGFKPGQILKNKNEVQQQKIIENAGF